MIISKTIGLFLPLMFVLGLLSGTNAQFGACDYQQIIEVGKSYYIFSPNYPNNYYPGTNCRWHAISDRPINMTCTNFQVPESQLCGVDVVIFQTSPEPGQRYCGTGQFSLVSKGNEIITELHSSQPSPGGRFLCTIEAVTTTTDEECRCGWKNPTRIVGGENTGVNEYPMMSGLVDFKDKYIFCGATIINNYQVVTAAHCVKNRNIPTYGVVVGEHDTERGDETNATRLFQVRSVEIHPQYSEQTQDYDIAIINVDGRIDFNQLVGPACLPFQHSPDTFGGNYVEILGWGSLGIAERQAHILQKVQVHVITNKECSINYPQITTRQLCTVETEKDACQFDSGGPVLWQNPSTRRIVLISVVSYGSICADGIPAVNSRVGAYDDWILLHTPKGFKYCEVE